MPSHLTDYFLNILVALSSMNFVIVVVRRELCHDSLYIDLTKPLASLVWQGPVGKRVDPQGGKYPWTCLMFSSLQCWLEGQAKSCLESARRGVVAQSQPDGSTSSKHWTDMKCVHLSSLIFQIRFCTVNVKCFKSRLNWGNFSCCRLIKGVICLKVLIESLNVD